MPFPYIFPFKFDEFIRRFIGFKNIDDALKFYGVDDNLMCTNIEDSLAFTMVGDSLMFGNIEDTIKFVEVTTE